MSNIYEKLVEISESMQSVKFSDGDFVEFNFENHTYIGLIIKIMMNDKSNIIYVIKRYTGENYLIEEKNIISKVNQLVKSKE